MICIYRSEPILVTKFFGSNKFSCPKNFVPKNLFSKYIGPKNFVLDLSRHLFHIELTPYLYQASPFAHQTTSRYLPDTFQTPSRHHQNTFQTLSRRLQDTLQTSSRHALVARKTPTKFQLPQKNFQVQFLAGWLAGWLAQ